MRHDAIEHLTRIAKTGSIDQDTADWIIEFSRCWHRNGGTLPIHRCMGMPTLNQYKRNQRDYYLRETAKLINGRSSKQVAVMLYTEASKFQVLIWPRHKSSEGLPASYGEIQHWLFAARRYGKFPETVRQFENILRNRFES